MYKGYIFKADEVKMAGSTAMSLVRKGKLAIVGKGYTEVILPDGRVILRKANIYKAME